MAIAIHLGIQYNGRIVGYSETFIASLCASRVVKDSNLEVFFDFLGQLLDYRIA